MCFEEIKQCDTEKQSNTAKEIIKEFSKERGCSGFMLLGWNDHERDLQIIAADNFPVGTGFAAIRRVFAEGDNEC